MKAIAPAAAAETFTFASDADRAPIFLRKWLPPWGIRPLASAQITHGVAVASPPRPTTIRWWTEATSVFLAAVHRMFPTSTADAGPARRHYPKRYEFLEHSCLSREIGRL